MKIALTGAHSTGKTTLVNKIIELDLLPGYEVSTNLTRKLRAAGYQISEHGDDDTQVAIMDIHYANLQHADIFMDRCALDCYVYSMYLYRHYKIKLCTIARMHEYAQKCLNEYEKIFYLVPEFEIEDDGVRPVNVEFQTEIAELFQNAIAMFKLNVIPLTGSVDARIETIKQTLGI